MTVRSGIAGPDLSPHHAQQPRSRRRASFTFWANLLTRQFFTTIRLVARWREDKRSINHCYRPLTSPSWRGPSQEAMMVTAHRMTGSVTSITLDSSEFWTGQIFSNASYDARMTISHKVLAVAIEGAGFCCDTRPARRRRRRHLWCASISLS